MSKKQYPVYEWGQQSKATGQCLCCGTTYQKAVHVTDKKGRSHVKRPLSVLWEQTNWFRGDDEIVGVVCKDCRSKYSPQQIGETLS